MKFSLKIRDDEHHQNPLFRAKVPITVLGLPFISGIIAGDPSDLSFNLSTNFPTGPSLKLSYNPTPTASTTADTPFSLSLKSGVGLFGSPYNSPLIISAHFNLFSNPNPSFSLQIKPQFGDFSLRKTTLSSPNPNPDPKLNGGCHSNGEYVNGFEPGRPMDLSDFTMESCPNPNPKENGGSHSNGGIGFAPERPLAWRDLKLESCNGKNGFPNPDATENGGSHSNNENGFASERPLVWRDLKKLKSCNGKDGILSGVAVRARTVLPVTSRLVVNFRWGVNFPVDKGSKLPFLTVDKIGVERVEELKEVKKKNSIESGVGDMELLKGMCFWMGKDLEVLQTENRELKQSLEDMRLRFSDRNYRGESGSVGKNVLSPSVENSGDFERWRSKSTSGEENGRRELKKSVNRVIDVESELQKAIKAAAAS